MCVLYFSYGSNMHTARMHKRIADAECVGRARLDGWRFGCNKSGVDGTAKANIEHDADAVVWGVIYRIPTASLERLDWIEGGYQRVTVEVSDDAGTTHHCQVYSSARLTDHPVPAAWYRQHILDGAAEHELPASYRAKLAALPALDDDPA